MTTTTPISGRAIRCGHCGKTHDRVDAVRACAAGTLTTCPWLVDVPRHWVVIDEETGETDYVDATTRECGAEAVITERGWCCAVGHEHVNAETRRAEGWDWAEEYDEALALAAAGVEPRTIDGHLVTGRADFTPVGA